MNRVKSGSTRDLILDLLDIDGGWWDKDQLAERLGVSVTTAERALLRMHAYGEVESRPGSEPRRFEWRLRS